MSTAVLISGQMRTFAACVANQNWTVFRRLNDPVFFISCADDAQASDAYLLEGYFPGKVHVEIVKQPDELPEPSFTLAAHAPYVPTPNNASVIKSIVRQLWHYRRVWDFMNKCEAAFFEKNKMVRAHRFDAFVRCRPDLFFHAFTMPHGFGSHTLTGNSFSVEPMSRQFFGPWKATCGGVNDRFSIMGSKAAEAYFLAYDKLQELLDAGCPLHPESIQRAALEAAHCHVSNTLLAEFTCLRLPGSGPHVPLAEYPGEMAAFLTATARG